MRFFYSHWIWTWTKTPRLVSETCMSVSQKQPSRVRPQSNLLCLTSAVFFLLGVRHSIFCSANGIKWLDPTRTLIRAYFWYYWIGTTWLLSFWMRISTELLEMYFIIKRVYKTIPWFVIILGIIILPYIIKTSRLLLLS